MFAEECEDRITKYRRDEAWSSASKDWLNMAFARKYMYNFTWLGVPVIQTPTDLHAMQEIIFRITPDLIIETGVAHGGSLVFYASMLELLGHGEVVGIEVDLRPHNRSAIESHKMSHRIALIEGSSIDQSVIDRVARHASGKRVLVALDSNHTHDHVLKELEAYAPLVSVDSYCVVFDTVVEDLAPDMFPDRPWGIGNNPKTAVHEFLKHNRDFEIDLAMQDKLQITVAPDGYLRRIR